MSDIPSLPRFELPCLCPNDENVDASYQLRRLNDHLVNTDVRCDDLKMVTTYFDKGVVARRWMARLSSKSGKGMKWLDAVADSLQAVSHCHIPDQQFIFLDVVCH